MNRILVIVTQILFTASVFFACNRSGTEGVTPVDSEDLKLVKEVERLSSSVVNLGYQKLNSEQKVLLWNRHLDKYLQSNTTSLALKEHINKLKAINTVSFHNSAGSEQRAAFTADFTRDWYTKPVEAGIFKADELLDLCIVHRLGVGDADPGNARTVAPNGTEPPGLLKKCNCSYNLGCAKRCATGGCQSGASDCGMFGGDKCTGACSV